MFDFPNAPTEGQTVTLPDGSYRVWDGTKWRAASPAGSGDLFLPLTGGVMTGLAQLVDDLSGLAGGGGGINATRTIAFTGRPADLANHPFTLNHTWTGTNLDVAGGGPVLGTAINNTLTGFNNGALGFRGFEVATFAGSGAMGPTMSAITSTVGQQLPHPPGVIPGTTTPVTWIADHDYPTAGVGVFNSIGSPYYVVTPGHSAATGAGPAGYGSAIVDGTVVWAYQGPGVPLRWAPFTAYSHGQLVINEINGAVFRAETDGQSGDLPGPIRPTGNMINSGYNYNAIPDGSMVWSLKNGGFNSNSYIGFIANAQAACNAGGMSIYETMGTQWGAVIGSRLNAMAQFYNASTPLEVDDVVLNPNVRNIMAMKIVRIGLQGKYVDVGLTITGAPGNALAGGGVAQGYKNAMMFNRCVDANGVGIAFEGIGSINYEHMAGAIDMRMVRADGTQGVFGGGYLLRTPYGMLDQFGGLQVRSGAVSWTANGMSIDLPNQELQSLTIQPGNGGANWSVGDGCKGDDGSFSIVQTVDANGGILTVHVATPSQQQVPLPTSVKLTPFNPEAPFAAFGTTPDPATLGKTGDVVWATPATATPVYAPPAPATLALGTNFASVINIGRAGATTTIAGAFNTGALNAAGLAQFTGDVLIGTTTDAGYILDVKGATRFAVTSQTHPLIVQANAALPATFAAGANLAIVGVDGAASRVSNYAYGTSPPSFAGVAARGTLAAPTATLAGDSFSRLTGRGYTGAGNSTEASLAILATENTTATANGTGFVFLGVLNGSTVLSQFAGVQNGNMQIGYINDTGFKLDVNGIARAVGIQTYALLTNAANDAAAATAGVALNQFYRNGSVVMQRAA